MVKFTMVKLKNANRLHAGPPIISVHDGGKGGRIYMMCFNSISCP